MTLRSIHSTYISHLVSSVLLLMLVLPVAAQRRTSHKHDVVAEKDTVALFRGFAVSVDVVGPAMRLFGDYGQYEAALHLNLRDRYFPAVEVGYGTCDHTEEQTNLTYKTSAPFFRLGCDFNLLKNKHDDYRLLIGARYAFTPYKYDLTSEGVDDPVWGGSSAYEMYGAKCTYHWLELGLGVDVKLFGPLHAGWYLRYKQRLSANEGPLGKSWYVPGYGTTGTSAFGALFNLSIDI